MKLARSYEAQKSKLKQVLTFLAKKHLIVEFLNTNELANVYCAVKGNL